MDMLNVTEKLKTNNSIVSYEFRTHQPFGSSSFDNNDEIRINVPEIDNYTVPGESYLYVEGSVKKAENNEVSATAKLVNNPVAFMFSDIRYLLNGVKVDSVRNLGVTSSMKGYFSFTKNEITKLENAGWAQNAESCNALDDKGNFSLSVPLRTLLGFAEDYKKIVLNARQELILIRNNDDNDVIIQPEASKDEKIKLVIDKVIWRVPHVTVGLREQLSLTKLTEKNIDIPIPFRSWEIHEYPSLPQTTKQTWAVKTSTQLETPRFIIIGFQNQRKGDVTKSMSKFDNIKLTNLSVYLNGIRYPYDNLNVDYTNNHFAILYDMYSRFQQSYYRQESEPMFSPTEYLQVAPLVGIDCTYQADSIHKSAVEIKVEFVTKEAVPAGTSAYCLILHDKAYNYAPLTKVVKELL